MGDWEIGGEIGILNELDKKNARRMYGNARVRFDVLKECTGCVSFMVYVFWNLR